MIRTVVTAALMLAGGQAAALVPLPPTCEILPGTTESGYWMSYEPIGLENDFVGFEAHSVASGGDDLVLVLEYCPQRRAVVATISDYLDRGDLADAARVLFDTMTSSSASYTMEQVNDVMNGAGAQSVIISVDFETCACATFAGG